MFRIINFNIIIKILVIGTALISIAAYLVWKRWDSELPLLSLAKIAPWAAFAVIFLLTKNFFARRIWKVAKMFYRDLFPDLNGIWDGEIIISETQSIPARAIIRQSFIRMQIDIHTETSKSVTLETTPTIEFDQCKIYYHYRAIPKNPMWDEYRGFTTFDIRTVTTGSHESLEISGAYFTSRQSVGRVRFRQISRDASGDVSYY
ncbi:hypothetical protein [Pseudomonas viridiflava]|uniref:Cap15 family cyclic dinucleotide receptor domain-containing protein n=1 Tax=Pseudomonas viridiflava TaxID=33069 RepID=UPI000F03D959|nr:hypothetical protein [Pseudomonas viridiflava]